MQILMYHVVPSLILSAFLVFGMEAAKGKLLQWSADLSRRQE